VYGKEVNMAIISGRYTNLISLTSQWNKHTLNVVLEAVKIMYLLIAYKIYSNEQNNNGKYNYIITMYIKIV